MQIIIKHGIRLLIKDSGEQIDVSDGSIIQYTAMHYKPRQNDTNIIDQIETKFIGKVETNRADYEGITGIYVRPLYLWDSEWTQISNYTPPKNKYFAYPHLLMVPGKYYHYYPLYFLHTCIPADLSDFTNVKKTIALDF